MHISIFISWKSSQILREYWCRPLSGMGEIKKISPISIKYTKIYYLCPLLYSQWPIFLYYFLMHNNQNVIIKIFITIYLLIVVLIPSIPSEGMHPSLIFTSGIMSIGSTKLEICPWNGQNRSNSNCCFSKNIRPLWDVFNFISLYTYSNKLLYSLIHPGKINIFAAPIFVVWSETSPWITYYIENWGHN